MSITILDHDFVVRSYEHMRDMCNDAQSGWTEERKKLWRVQDELSAMRSSLRMALNVIEDYIDYKHNGDPTVEDARTMGEMDINDYAVDGRMERAKALVNGEFSSGGISGDL